MKIILMNLAVNTQNNAFHRMGIAGKLDLIERCLEKFQRQITGLHVSSAQPFKAMLVAPEYFFARCCPETGGIGARHYEYKDYVYIRKELTKLSKKYRGILIVPGTIAWKSPLINGTLAPPVAIAGAAPNPSWASREFPNETIYNLHMRSIGDVHTDGSLLKSWAAYNREQPDHAAIEAVRCIRSKFGTLASAMPGKYPDFPTDKLNLLKGIINPGIDPYNYIYALAKGGNRFTFGRNTAFFYLNGRVVASYTKHSDYQEAFSINAMGREKVIAVNDDGPVVLNIGGINFGVEICFDHNRQVLQSYIDDGGIRPDIHLIMSAIVRDNDPIPGIPIRIHSSVTSALSHTYTSLPIVDSELTGFSTADRLAVFEGGDLEFTPAIERDAVRCRPATAWAGAGGRGGGSGWSHDAMMS